MTVDKPLLVETSKGMSIKYKNRLLYSKYDPLKSVLKLIDNLKFQEDTIYIFTSPLLGYGLKELQNRIPNSSMLLQLELDSLLYSISNNKNDIIIIRNGFDFISILNKLNFSTFKRCELINLNGGYELHKSEYDNILQILLKQLHTYWKNRYTLTQMGHLWIKNSIKNLPYLDKSKPYTEIKTNKPIVIIGAGESTEKILDLLITYREKVFILCVDTALQILLEYDITPDVVLALEAQFYNLPDFYGAKDKNIDIIYDLSSYPGVLRNLTGNKYHSITKFSDSNLLTKIKNMGISDEMLPPLGSVGITAIYIGLKIAKNSIFLAGLDFAYRRGKTHSKGSPYHISSLIGWNKLNPGDSYINCLKRPLQDVKNKVGDIENTDTILYEYSLYAKELLCGTNNIFDLTQNGMDLGVPLINNDEFIKIIDTEYISPKTNKYQYTTTGLTLYNEIEIDLNNSLKALKKVIIGETQLKDIIHIVNKVGYFFEHYPEKEPLNNLNESNINRYYITLLRFSKKIKGQNLTGFPDSPNYHP
ncbi:MAG: DUF115 domain-containing protein [Spirochaetaceae bacterium]